MRKVLTLLVLMFGLQVSSVVAAGLDQSVIKLSRMSAGTSPLPILVTVKTLSGVTEDGLKIIVGNGWNTSNLKTDITVSISGLPTGLSPLPGITSANGVLGQVISFPSSDLVSGTTYGFYITGGIGVNPVAGDGANYKWRIQTLSGAVIDEESELKVPIIANDQVTIAGRVGASATDFQLDLVASGSATLNQNQEKEYQITYGSYLNSATKPLKIVVEWTQGTIGGQGVPTLDIADYVPGSASTADSGAVPVIDTVNRRIEWLINSFPANTQDKTVSFKLKTNSSYVGSSQVNFSVKAWLYGANVVSINKTVVNTYQYYLPMVPTSVPSETSNSTTTNTTSSSAPLPITTLALRIEKIDMVRLTDNLATVLVDSNVEPERTKIYYGTSIGSLNKSLISINKTKSQEITIDNG